MRTHSLAVNRWQRGAQHSNTMFDEVPKTDLHTMGNEHSDEEYYTNSPDNAARKYKHQTSYTQEEQANYSRLDRSLAWNSSLPTHTIFDGLNHTTTSIKPRDFQSSPSNAASDGSFAPRKRPTKVPKPKPPQVPYNSFLAMAELTSTLSHLFRNLPIELRIMILEMAIIRTVNLRLSENNNSFQYDFYSNDNTIRGFLTTNREFLAAIKQDYQMLSTNYKSVIYKQCQKTTYFNFSYDVLHVEGNPKSPWQCKSIIKFLPQKDKFQHLSITHTELWLDTSTSKGKDQPMVLLFKNVKTVDIDVTLRPKSIPMPIHEIHGTAAKKASKAAEEKAAAENAKAEPPKVAKQAKIANQIEVPSALSAPPVVRTPQVINTPPQSGLIEDYGDPDEYYSDNPTVDLWKPGPLWNS
ncbi:uncharacterized protein PAC_02560 [Phialocephala subalpina]|uniref:2EXR domain-containing protein n=1 Tax=Phialocephala subalpina TaxID=576137 RepID=A0A1L7WIS9_9HELO|nr:uncharacterized protein PAC_02560 [Phialocephala subalpina]